MWGANRKPPPRGGATSNNDDVVEEVGTLGEEEELCSSCPALHPVITPGDEEVVVYHAITPGCDDAVGGSCGLRGILGPSGFDANL